MTLRSPECEQLFQSLIKLVKITVFHGYTEISDMTSLFPVSLPRLIDFDWRVDLKVSSDSLIRMAVPTCLLQLQVQANPSDVNQDPQTNVVNIEMSKDTLDTMLDGLGKIRDQLSSVVNR
ncbi:hypothetical protein LSH36_1015g00000 [Paralvinella palmiformis]|uniref:COMM domain-containing protein n=1 Tax=Paralvinella palmiformis TaxID=53620 RepID=A0AAD9MS82_9ANNE|nr:hypothetical protein LSH36_1015g00000 [Paralvinella palmiformis]